MMMMMMRQNSFRKEVLEDMHSACQTGKICTLHVFVFPLFLALFLLSHVHIFLRDFAFSEQTTECESLHVIQATLKTRKTCFINN